MTSPLRLRAGSSQRQILSVELSLPFRGPESFHVILGYHLEQRLATQFGLGPWFLLPDCGVQSRPAQWVAYQKYIKGSKQLPESLASPGLTTDLS